ncbi:unnamed protein product [Owenia fusiformis]|uniref:Uncharacterized protein n=1 Tax=Owenia fusiformis TaxID=6347 RepID=A0A8J1TD88_OWEFU|nr:unnamed protein product [Owenia fusiformis]
MDRQGGFLRILFAICIAACIESTFGVKCTEPPDAFVGRFKISLVYGREVDISKDGLTATGPAIPPGPTYGGGRAFWELEKRLPFEQIHCTKHSLTIVFGQQLIGPHDETEKGYQCLTLRHDGTGGDLIGQFVYDPRITEETKDSVNCFTIGKRRNDDYFVSHVLEALFTKTTKLPKLTEYSSTDGTSSTTTLSNEDTVGNPSTPTDGLSFIDKVSKTDTTGNPSIPVNGLSSIGTLSNTDTGGNPSTPTDGLSSISILSDTDRGGNPSTQTDGVTFIGTLSNTDTGGNPSIDGLSSISILSDTDARGKQSIPAIGLSFIGTINTDTGGNPSTLTASTKPTLIKCNAKYCQNGGTCFEASNGPTCSCTTSFTGPRCAIEIKDQPTLRETTQQTLLREKRTEGPRIKRSPLMSAISTSTAEPPATIPTEMECSEGFCKNGGTCSDDGSGPICSCTTTYTGLRCMESVDPCSTNPCKLIGTTCGEDPKSHLGYVCKTEKETVTAKMAKTTDPNRTFTDNKPPLDDKSKVIATFLAAVMLLIISGVLFVYVRSLTTGKYGPDNINDIDAEKELGEKLLTKSNMNSQIHSDLNNNNNVAKQHDRVPGVIAKASRKKARRNSRNTNTKLYESRPNWRHKKQHSTSAAEIECIKTNEADRHTNNKGNTLQAKSAECTPRFEYANMSSFQYGGGDCLKKPSPGANTSRTTGANTCMTTGLNAGRTTGAYTSMTMGLNASRTIGANTCMTTGLNAGRTTGAYTSMTMGLNASRTIGANTCMPTGLNASRTMETNTSMTMGLNASRTIGANTCMTTGLDASRTMETNTSMTTGPNISGTTGTDTCRTTGASVSRSQGHSASFAAQSDSNKDQMPSTTEETVYFPPLLINQFGPQYNFTDSNNAMDYLVEFIENNYPNE